MSSFAYSVAIRLSVANLASQGVRILANDLLAAHGAASNLQGKLSALKMVAVGYGLEKTGQGILGFMGKSIEAATEYTAQLSLMNAAGMDHAEVARATAAAWQTSQLVVTSSAAENLKAIRELRSVFGIKHMDEAYAILPTVQRTRATLEALTGKPQEGVAFDMVKAIELRTPGVMTQERMQRNADLMARSLMGMGGTLNVNDFHMALKQAKTSAFGLSDDFTYNYLPTLIQEVKTKGGGAQTAGTALMSTYSALVQGTMKKSAIPLWEEMGLINPRDVVKNSTGALQLKPGAVKDVQLFQQNPYEWANKVLAPAITKYGADHNLNREQVISGLFGNRNAQWFINTMIGKAQQFQRDRDLIQSGGTSKEAYDRLLQSNPMLAKQALDNQWQNLLSILGYQILPKMIPFMIKFANGLNAISSWMEKHPNATSAIAFGLVGIGVALDGIGKALMLAGIIKFLGLGPMIGGFFGFAARGFGLLMTAGRIAIGGLGALFTPVGLIIAGIALVALLVWNNWKEIKGNLIKSWADIKDGFSKLFHGDILGALGSFSAVFIRSWQTIFNTLIAGVNSLLPGMLQIGKFHFADDFDAWRKGQDKTKPPAAASVPINQWPQPRPTSVTVPPARPVPGVAVPRFLAPAATRPTAMMSAPMSSPAAINPVAPARADRKLASGDVYLDGRKVGRIINGYATDQLSRPQMGTSGFSSAMARPSVGAA